MTKERAERLRLAAATALRLYEEVRVKALEMADRLEKRGGFSSENGIRIGGYEMEKALSLLEEAKQRRDVYLQAMENYKRALSELGVDWKTLVKEE